jgi:hypothetical protein
VWNDAPWRPPMECPMGPMSAKTIGALSRLGGLRS